MRKENTGNIEREMLIGNTKIKICGDCCLGRSPEETRTILERIARLAFSELFSDLKIKNAQK